MVDHESKLLLSRAVPLLPSLDLALTALHSFHTPMTAAQ